MNLESTIVWQHDRWTDYNYFGIQREAIIGPIVCEGSSIYQPFVGVQQANPVFCCPMSPAQYPGFVFAWLWIPRLPIFYLLQDQMQNSSLQQQDVAFGNLGRQDLIRSSDIQTINFQHRLQRVNGRRFDHIVCRDIEREDIEGDGCMCAICLDEFRVGEEIRQTPCKHLFHKNCADKWFAVKLACPLCANDLSR